MFVSGPACVEFRSYFRTDPTWEGGLGRVKDQCFCRTFNVIVYPGAKVK